jgi:hypothetical protein
MRLNLIDKIGVSELRGAAYLNDVFLSNYKNEQLMDINPLLIASQ